MIEERCFERKWIEDFKQQPAYSRINPPVLEKMIHALSLLQHLSQQSLDFVFKGGTSLVLLFETPKRFSVDIDIMTTSSREQIELALDRIIAQSHFTSWRLDGHRSYQPGIPKAHYELAFRSHFNDQVSYILLDVVYGQHRYPEVGMRAIRTNFIATSTHLEVLVPTVDAIIGDKLTAFAPNTTGIRYGVGKEQEIIKQLFDIGNLFDHHREISTIRESFWAFAWQEIGYRQMDITPEDVLRDILQTCRVLALRERNAAKPDQLRFQELQNGIKRFGGFLVSGAFRIDEAIAAAGKAALLAAAMLHEDLQPVRIASVRDLPTMEVAGLEWNFLNRLKKMPDKSAFLAWHGAVRTLERPPTPVLAAH